MALRLACFASGRGSRAAAASRTARERAPAASVALFEISGIRRRHRLEAQPVSVRPFSDVRVDSTAALNEHLLAGVAIFCWQMRL